MPRSDPEPAAPASPLLTFMFVDAENFTQMTERLGDEVAARCLDDFHAVIRAAGERHGGAEVNRMGDLAFLLFRSADDALACAVEIRNRLASEADAGLL